MPRFETSDGVSLHYTDEGGDENGGLPVLCLAGLTRNGADFAHVLPHLGGRRVIRLDYRGRGLSERADPATYTVRREGQDSIELLDRLGLDSAAVLGTSRGGLIAMSLALSDPLRLAAAILNDIGPEIDLAGLDKIRGYIGQVPDLPDLDAAAAALSATPGFEGVPPARWRAEAEARFNAAPGGLELSYDPALRDAFLQGGPSGPVDLWAGFEALARIPCGAIRAAQSDILTAETFAAMQRRVPRLHAATVPGRAHVPFLDEPEALGVIHAVLGEAAS